MTTPGSQVEHLNTKKAQISSSNKPEDIATLAYIWGFPLVTMRYVIPTGDYGTDYLFRAAIAQLGLGANIAQEAFYPITFTDGFQYVRHEVHRVGHTIF
jgi:hypothetical protein